MITVQRQLSEESVYHNNFVKFLIFLIVTLVCGVSICFLVFAEFVDFRRVIWKSELAVDKSGSEQMTIDFDISFTKVPCFGKA